MLFLFYAGDQTSSLAEFQRVKFLWPRTEPYTSSANEMTVKFTTDNIGVQTGFVLSYVETGMVYFIIVTIWLLTNATHV